LVWRPSAPSPGGIPRDRPLVSDLSSSAYLWVEALRQIFRPVIQPSCSSMAPDGYPYTPVPGRLEELLKKLHQMGRPAKADQAWMKQQGYTSGNDKMTLAAMRRLGMIGSDGQPTEFFDAVRNQDGGGVADGIRRAYAELFQLYPDAQRKDAEALQTFFRSKTSAGARVQQLTVKTFQVLCKFADFDEGGPPIKTPRPQEPERRKERRRSQPSGEVVREAGGGGLTLNVNIQLQLPPSADGDVYEKLFEAMGKHLKGLASLE
jgi:hypothetical protein